MNPLAAQADAARKRLRARMRWNQADTAARLEAWAEDGIPTVLMEGGVPQEFLKTPKALLSECSSLMAVVSGLDGRGVEYLRILFSGSKLPELRVVLIVHATCSTKEKDLFDVLALLGTKRLQAWVLPVDSWGQRCSWVLAARQDSLSYVLWTSSSGNFGMANPHVDEAHLVTDADPLVVDQFVSWFCRLANAAAPLTAATAHIPDLVPAQGTQEAAEMWDRYASRCIEETLASQVMSIKSVIADSPQTTAPQSVEVVEEKIREELKIPKPDPLLAQLVHLFEKGDLVMIDKGSRIPPFEVPIKAEWFGIPSFREVGVVSREVRYRISVLDDRTNKSLDARRKDTSDLREKFSFPLADGSRWMPHQAKGLFEVELKRHEEEGKKLLGSIVSGTPEDWVESKRDLVTRDANRQYEEFHPGKRMPEETINEMLTALTGRFRKATSGTFLPKVSFVKTSFRLGGDSEHVSDWATARTLLRAVAGYPRAALKSRAYFFRGLKVSEKDLLTAMNVADDQLVARWSQPDSMDIALEELQVLEQIDESEQSDHDKCKLILDLLHRARSLDDIRNSAKKVG